MDCPPRPPSPKVQEAPPAPPTTSPPVLLTSDGHLVFPLPLVQGVEHTALPPAPTPSPTPSDTPTPTVTRTPTPTPPSTHTPTVNRTTFTQTHTPARPTTPRRPTPRRPAPQPPTRPAPPTTPIPQPPTPTTASGPPTVSSQTAPTDTRTITPISEAPLATTPVPEKFLVTTATPTSPGIGVGGLSLRLIDDETETDDDDGRCDSFEERLVFPPRQVVPVTTPRPLHPPQPVYALTTPTVPLTRPVYPQQQVDWYGENRHSSRGLSHSSSDPGVRRQRVWAPPVPPLAEEEGEGGHRVLHSQIHKAEGVISPRLVRSDSVVTVPEDLLTPRPSLAGVAAAALIAAAVMPGTAMLLHAAFRLVFGTLFPAYYSYKAVKTKNVKEYVKWMMYWIVFAFFTCLETLTDIFLSFWFPFYYELKILVVLWLLSPATRGSSILYRKFVHPWLTRREEDIDNCIAQAKQQGYSAVLSLGSKGVNYATTVIMQTAIKGGGGIMNQLKRSYSSGELIGDDGDLNRNIKPLPPHMQDQGYDDPHLRPGPPGTPKAPQFTPLTPTTPQYTPHYPTPSSLYSTTSTPLHIFPGEVCYGPPSPPIPGGDLGAPPSPPLTRLRLRQQQQQQQQRRRSRLEEEVVKEEEEEEMINFGAH